MNEKNEQNPQFDDEDWEIVVQSDGNRIGTAAGAEAPGAAARKEDRTQKSAGNPKRRKQLIGLCVAGGVFIVLFIVVMILTASMLSNDTVYEGVTLNGQSVSGMTRAELQEYIRTRYIVPLNDANVVLEIDAQQKAYAATDFVELPDVTTLASQIYSAGREGSAVSRLFGIFELREKPRDFTLSYTVKQSVLDEILALTESQQYISKIEPSYKIEEGQIVFTYGRDGLEITESSLKENFEEFAENLQKTFREKETEAGGTYTIRIEPKKTEFRRIRKVNILNELKLESRNAAFERISEKQISITPEFVGIALDEALLDEILARVNAGTDREEKTEVLPLPKAKVILTADFYRTRLYRDVLGSSSNRNNVEEGLDGMYEAEERAQNIGAAAAQLNGYIVLPGETFSFLEALGTLSPEVYTEAYEDYAGVYTKVLGGGISQVASALYGAVYTASLTVNEHHHYDYMPNFGLAGFDAYVSSGENKDLTFVNSYTFPIRIDAVYQNNTIKVDIRGIFYRESDFEGLEPEEIPVILEPERENTLSAEIVSRVNYKTLEKTDSSLPAGSRVVTVSGITGYTVNLYMVTTVDGNDQRKLLEQVTYKARDEQVTVGTGTQKEGNEDGNAAEE